MGTFVVTFIGDQSSGFKGRVQHVPSGEEALFKTVTDLLVFFEEMNAVSNVGGNDGEIPLEREPV
jgi:hypothetical protein